MNEYWFYTLLRHKNSDIELEEKSVVLKETSHRITDPDKNYFPHSYRWTMDKTMLDVVCTEHLDSDCVCNVVLDECNKDRAASLIREHLNKRIENLLSEVVDLTELKDAID